MLAIAAIWAGLAIAPKPARAWTETQVQSARVHVDLDRDARAVVALELDVKVRGGWLEGLEVAGLDPDLELSEEKPPWVVSTEGTKFRPDVRARNGRVQLRFDDRPSPRRGRYHVGLVYTTKLAHRATRPLESGDVRVTWTLPGWRTGLDAVRVSVTAPAGAEFSDEQGSAVERTRRAAGGRVLLESRRAHLPRTVAWPIAIDVPAAAMAAELGTDQLPAPTVKPRDAGPAKHEAIAPRERAEGNRGWVVLTCLLAALALARRTLFVAACRRCRVPSEPALRLPEVGRVLAILSAAAAAWTFGAQSASHPWWTDGTLAVGGIDPMAWLGAHRASEWLAHALLVVIPLLAWERTPRSASPPRLGQWRHASDAMVEQAARAWRRRWLSPLMFFDLRSPAGWLTMGAVLVLVRAGAGGTTLTTVWALVLSAPLMLAGTPRQLPRTVLERLGALVAAAPTVTERWRSGSPPELVPVVHVAGDGRWQDARLRVEGVRWLPGLVRCDAALADRASAMELTPELAMIVVTRPGSPAERAMQLAAPDVAVREAPGGRSQARVLSPSRISPITVIRSCAAGTPRPVEARSGRADALREWLPLKRSA